MLYIRLLRDCSRALIFSFREVMSGLSLSYVHTWTDIKFTSGRTVSTKFLDSKKMWHHLRGSEKKGLTFRSNLSDNAKEEMENRLDLSVNPFFSVPLKWCQIFIFFWKFPRYCPTTCELIICLFLINWAFL